MHMCQSVDDIGHRLKNTHIGNITMLMHFRFNNLNSFVCGECHHKRQQRKNTLHMKCQSSASWIIITIHLFSFSMEMSSKIFADDQRLTANDIQKSLKRNDAFSFTIQYSCHQIIKCNFTRHDIGLSYHSNVWNIEALETKTEYTNLNRLFIWSHSIFQRIACNF